MRRLRQAAPKLESSAMVRLACALAISLGLHAAVLGVPGARSDPPSRPRMAPLQATLEPAQAQRASPVARKAAPKEQSTPVAWPETAREGVLDAPHFPAAEVPGALAPAGMPLLHDPVHYEARDLDTYPQLRDPLKPVYPAPARTSGIAGAVTLMVLIDETGRVTDASVVDARPEGYFDDSARNAIAQASFLPASKGGRAVRSRILVSISYDPAEAY